MEPSISSPRFPPDLSGFVAGGFQEGPTSTITFEVSMPTQGFSTVAPKENHETSQARLLGKRSCGRTPWCAAAAPGRPLVLSEQTRNAPYPDRSHL
jgi:hypothetical protein